MSVKASNFSVYEEGGNCDIFYFRFLLTPLDFVLLLLTFFFGFDFLDRFVLWGFLLVVLEEDLFLLPRPNWVCRMLGNRGVCILFKFMQPPPPI